MKEHDKIKFINFLKGNINLEYNEFKKLLLEYFSEYIDKLYEKYNCKFVISNDIKALGMCIGTSKIIINENVVDNIYKGNLYFLTVIFHEISHLEQNVKIKEGNYSVNIIEYIKDKLLCKYQDEQNKKYGYYAPSYYNINYTCESSEIDADLNSLLLILKFCLENKIYLSDETTNMIEKHAHQIKLKQARKRYVGGNAIFNTYYSSLNEAFDFAIKDHPEWLEIYPQLRMEYYIVDSKIYKKDLVKEEQVDDTKMASSYKKRRCLY